MLKSRVTYLVLLCLGLGALVWIDNQKAAPPGVEGPPPSANPYRLYSDDGGEPPQGTTDQTGAEVDALDTPAPPPGNPLSSFAKAELKDTVERPLFSQNRKRPPQTASERPAANQQRKPPPPELDLLGIVRSDRREIALLRRKNDGTLLRVGVGDSIAGWLVAKMGTKAIVLQSSDGTAQDLQLY